MKQEDIDNIATLGREAREYLEASSQHPHHSKLSNVLYDAAMRCISEMHRIFDKQDNRTSKITEADASYIQRTLSLLNSMINAGESHSFQSNERYMNTKTILSKYTDNTVVYKTLEVPRSPADNIRIAGINYRIDENGHIKFADYDNGETVDENATVTDGSEHEKYTGTQHTSLFTDDLYEFDVNVNRTKKDEI